MEHMLNCRNHLLKKITRWNQVFFSVTCFFFVMRRYFVWQISIALLLALKQGSSFILGSSYDYWQTCFFLHIDNSSRLSHMYCIQMCYFSISCYIHISNGFSPRITRDELLSQKKKTDRTSSGVCKKNANMQYRQYIV